MIKEVIMYTVICDNCNEDVAQDEEFSCWSDSGFSKANAMEADWIEEDGKHYCPDCYSYDDNDNLIIKEIRK